MGLIEDWKEFGKTKEDMKTALSAYLEGLIGITFVLGVISVCNPSDIYLGIYLFVLEILGISGGFMMVIVKYLNGKEPMNNKYTTKTA